MGKLTKRQTRALRLLCDGPRSAYPGISMETLNTLSYRGLVTDKRGIWSIAMPYPAIIWSITPAGRAALQEHEAQLDEMIERVKLSKPQVDGLEWLYVDGSGRQHCGLRGSRDPSLVTMRSLVRLGPAKRVTGHDPVYPSFALTDAGRQALRSQSETMK